jgi:AraC-like DNA-binding protein
MRDYRRLSRFTQALSQIMVLPQAASGALTRIAQDGGYTDQSHLIRDFRELLGDAPKSFMKAYAEEGSAYQFWRFPKEVLHSFMD